MNALLICDSPEESALLAFLAQEAGLTSQSRSELEGAMTSYGEHPADLIVVASRELPIADQVRRVRQEATAYLAVIAEGVREDEVCKSYELGADLVVVRPYSARLVLQQLRALVRRSQGTVLSILPNMRIGELALNPTARTAQVGRRHARRLTQLEFRLLYTLMLHNGHVVPTETIVERVWGYEGDGSAQLVRGLVRRLRTKIEEDPRKPRFVLSVPGVGYRLDTPQPAWLDTQDVPV
jgi:DNA-binding response OmpR family regulator